MKIFSSYFLCDFVINTHVSIAIMHQVINTICGLAPIGPESAIVLTQIIFASDVSNDGTGLCDFHISINVVRQLKDRCDDIEISHKMTGYFWSFSLHLQYHYVARTVTMYQWKNNLQCLHTMMILQVRRLA